MELTASLRVALLGFTSMDSPHFPFTSLTTKEPAPPLVLKLPPALQLPGEVHEMELTEAKFPVLRLAVPGTSTALPQLPFTSLAKNACPASPAEFETY
jgi:hypothetical protein